MVDKLKPCPFCGSKAELYQNIKEDGTGDFNGRYFVRCDPCDLVIDSAWDVPEAEAIAAWNRRTPANGEQVERDDIVTRTPTEDARSRVKVLEEALEAIRDGDVPRPVHCQWRADGKPSKLDECKHGVTMSEDCAGCINEFVATALGNKETDRHG